MGNLSKAVQDLEIFVNKTPEGKEYVHELAELKHEIDKKRKKDAQEETKEIGVKRSTIRVKFQELYGTYTGEHLNNRMHGFGILVTDDGSKWEG
jgi:hypothetical protein